jgi:hypothetical protein
VKLINKNIEALATNPWFVVVGGVTSIVGFIGYFYEKVDPSFTTIGRTVLGLGVIILFFGYVYSIRVRAENIALREMSYYFYQINEIYKARLRDSFFGASPHTDATSLLDSEQLVLRSVCQRIESIFSRAIGRKCMVTVKLITRQNGKVSAHTYVRNQESCERDNPVKEDFSVGEGRNTAFEQALLKNADGRPAHFHSADLTKQKGYSNERQHFLKFYKSTIVVPIRGELVNSTDKDPLEDHIGYLCVDTLSVNRLNDRYHLYMIAALAHQMYNFMSLMRGRYKVAVGGIDVNK